jgi:predicted dienelactone hydrolase
VSKDSRVRRGLAWAAVLLALAVTAGAAAALILDTGSGDTTPTARPGHVAAAGAATTPLQLPLLGPSDPAPTPPFGVGVVTTTYVDESRETPARGDEPALPSRSLLVTIRYPVAGPPGPDETADAPALDGHFPLVMFAHGYAGSNEMYESLLHDLAAEGFVIAAPEFPLSSGALPGPPIRDPVAQAGDVSFVLDQLLDPTTRPEPLDDLVFDEPVGVVGHSDGAVTAAGLAASSCCADPRIGAAAILSGALSFFPGGWFTAPTPPLLVMAAGDDTINPTGSEDVYDAAPAPKMFVVVDGAEHLPAFIDDSSRPAVAKLIGDFLRADLLSDASSAQQLFADADVPGVLELLGAE